MEIIVFLAGVVLGWVWHARVMIKRLLNDPDRMILLLKDLKQERQRLDENLARLAQIDKPLALEVLEHDGICYVWLEHNREFLGQGETVDQALAKSKFQGRKFKLVNLPEQSSQ